MTYQRSIISKSFSGLHKNIRIYKNNEIMPMYYNTWFVIVHCDTDRKQTIFVSVSLIKTF